MDVVLKPEDQVVVVDDFLEMQTAQLMRNSIQRHFANPGSHRSEHQIWNYWHVPGFYTYLRTDSDRVIDRNLLSDLVGKIRDFIERRIERPVTVSWPYLSIYTSGMGQCWHNDACYGLMGWVYSLTESHLDGGSTLVWRGTNRSAVTVVGPSLHHIIEPLFNRLVLFDDQIPHAVSTVQGSMDPLLGRAVLHGHVNVHPQTP